MQEIKRKHSPLLPGISMINESEDVAVNFLVDVAEGGTELV